jgi:acyl-CoA thioester hydrolase
MISEATERDGETVYEGRVRPEWIDVNDHMNVAYYVLAFDQGVDALWARFGVTDEYIRDGLGSTFAVESHVTWKREMRLDDPYVITSQVLAYDAKRIHQFMRMYHAGEGFLAATAEWMNLHVDLLGRRVTPWPGDILERIAGFVATQDCKRRPAEAGSRIQVPAPYWSIEDYSW